MDLGVNVASINDVAQRLGSTKGRIYHHFPSKEALVTTVRMRTPQITHDAVIRVKDMSLPAGKNFHNMARAHVRAVLDHLPYFKVYAKTMSGTTVKSPSPRDLEMHQQVLDAAGAYEDLYRDVLAQGMAHGVFRKQDLSVTLHSVIILLNAPVFWYTPRTPQSAAFEDQMIAHLADMALTSLQ